MSVELATNTEARRPGEVAIGVILPAGALPSGFAWVSAERARAFAMDLLRAARDAEDLVADDLDEFISEQIKADPAFARELESREYPQVPSGGGR